MQRDSYGNAIPAFLWGATVSKATTQTFQNTYDSILIRVATKANDVHLHVSADGSHAGHGTFLPKNTVEYTLVPKDWYVYVDGGDVDFTVCL